MTLMFASKSKFCFINKMLVLNTKLVSDLLWFCDLIESQSQM